MHSRMHSRTTAPSRTARAGIIISSGNAVVKIDGRLNENLYRRAPSQESQITVYDDTPAIIEGSVTKNETRIMSSGDEYNFSILPTEVVTINIRSMDGNDVELVVFRRGREENYTIPGTNMLGMSIGFTNR